MTGLDTGFFLLLFRADGEALAVWNSIRSCTELYTTDADMLKYSGGPDVVLMKR